MATTRSSITRLLRAATTIPLRAHHTFHSPLKTTSPFSFPRSNLPISRHQFFSTSRRVPPRATKYKLWRSTALSLLCIYGGYKVVLYKLLRSVDNDRMGTKFKGSLPNLFHKGHSVVVEGKFTLTGCNPFSYDFEYCFSATEVVLTTKPDQLAAAMERNNYILAQKLNVAEDDVEQQNVAGEELYVALNRCTILSDEISNDGLVLQGRVNQSRAFSPIAKKLCAVMIKGVLADFKGLPDALLKGHSVVVERSVKMIDHKSKEEDESGKSVAVKVEGEELHISAEVLAKHDDKYMPQDAAASGGGIEEEES